MAKKKKQLSKESKNAISSLANFLGSLIPGAGISASVYYLRKKFQVKPQALVNNQSVVEYLESDLKNKIANIAALNEYDLASLAIDLNAFFKADRNFRKDWVVAGYWNAYSRCSSSTKLGLDAASKW